MKFKLIVINKSIDTELAIGTHYQSEINIAPKKLTETFGWPNSGDGYKVSGEYLFKSAKPVPNNCSNCDIFTLYDWKWTTWYDKDNPYTPKQFWKLDKPIRFNIGGKSKQYIDNFKKWIKSTVDSNY